MRSTIMTLATMGLMAAAPQAPVQPAGLTPKSPIDSPLRVRLERAGRIPTTTNPTSPVAAGSRLLLIDQSGYLYSWDGASTSTLLTPKTYPPGISPLGAEPLLNVAADRTGSKLYVIFISQSAPRDVPRRTSPREPDGWYVLVEYPFDGGALGRPRPITAMQVRSEGHVGGGLAVLDDGSVLFAPGDNGDSYEDGRANGQNPAVHLAKLVRIDVTSGATEIVASGVRATQRLALYTFSGERWVTFVDPGGWVSEEIDAIRTSDLSTQNMPNFGWGINTRDGKAREGTFYINGIGNSVGKIVTPEAGFIDPVAEFGRERTEPVAVSGPLHSDSFSRIGLLFGDLLSGNLFAVTAPPSMRGQDVLRVGIVDDKGQPTTLKTLTGGMRPDPRFFNFPDGSGGILLERTGDFYRLSEVQ